VENLCRSFLIRLAHRAIQYTLTWSIHIAPPRPGTGDGLLCISCTKRMGPQDIPSFPYAFRRCAALERVYSLAGLVRQKGKTIGATQLRYPRWQEPLLRAVMETKPDSLMEKIQIADTAISQRLRELESNQRSKEERATLWSTTLICCLAHSSLRSSPDKRPSRSYKVLLQTSGCILSLAS
jgi:hypothetical protein